MKQLATLKASYFLEKWIQIFGMNFQNAQKYFQKSFYASATKHLGIGMLVGWSVGWSRHKFQKSSHTHTRRRKTSYDVARLILMVPSEPWQNSTPFFGAAAFCTTKIDDFRASSMLSSLTTWSTHSSKRMPLRKDQLGGTKGRYSPYV